MVIVEWLISRSLAFECLSLIIMCDKYIIIRVCWNFLIYQLIKTLIIENYNNILTNLIILIKNKIFL